MTDHELDKWGNYYRYFYLCDVMTFVEFLKLVEKGMIPKRVKVDWSRIEGAFEGDKVI